MSKSYVSMEQAICPVCGTIFDTNTILLDRKLHASMESHTVTHYELCPEHAKLDKDGYVALCAIPHAPVEGEAKLTVGTERTGSIAHIRRTALKNIFPHIPDDAINGPLIFVEEKVIEDLQKLVNQKEGE